MKIISSSSRISIFWKSAFVKNDLLKRGGGDVGAPGSHPPPDAAGGRLSSLLSLLLSSSLYKAPWARVLVYGLGHKVKRNGQLNLIEAVCYPRDASPANTGLTPPPTTNQYPSVILSTDKVHIKLGKS